MGTEGQNCGYPSCSSARTIADPTIPVSCHIDFRIFFHHLISQPFFQIFLQITFDALLPPTATFCMSCFGHDPHQFFKRSFGRVPAQLGSCLGGISPQVYHVYRTVEIGETSHQHLAGALSMPFSSMPSPVISSSMPAYSERQLRNSRNGMLFAGGNDKILQLLVLQDQPHALHIILA